jgi:hypothetical protein
MRQPVAGVPISSAPESPTGTPALLRRERIRAQGRGSGLPGGLSVRRPGSAPKRRMPPSVCHLTAVKWQTLDLAAKSQVGTEPQTRARLDLCLPGQSGDGRTGSPKPAPTRKCSVRCSLAPQHPVRSLRRGGSCGSGAQRRELAAQLIGAGEHGVHGVGAGAIQAQHRWRRP